MLQLISASNYNKILYHTITDRTNIIIIIIITTTTTTITTTINIISDSNSPVSRA